MIDLNIFVSKQTIGHAKAITKNFLLHNFYFFLLNFSQSDLQIKFDDLNYRNVGPTRGGRSTTVCGVVKIHLHFIWAPQGWSLEDF